MKLSADFIEKKFTLRIVLIYVLISSLWILLSSILLSTHKLDVEGYIFFDTMKSAFFMIITATILYLLLYQNIMVLNKSKAAIKKSKIMYKTIFANTRSAILIIDEKFNILLANTEFSRITSFSADEIKGSLNLCQITAKDKWKEIEACLKDKKSIIENYETKIIDKYQKEIDVILNMALTPDPGKIILSFIDISKRKQAEDALRKSEGNYQALINAIPDTIFRINEEGYYLDYYPGEEKCFPDQEVVTGKNICEIMPPPITHKLLKSVRKSIRSKTICECEYVIELDHSRYFHEARIVSNSVNEAIMIIRDFTKRKQADEDAVLHQQQLIQADKMATLGILVAGVAHEINNPNNYILLNGNIISRVWKDISPILTDYYQRDKEFKLVGIPFARSYPKVGKLIDGISEGAHRIQSIVLNLKDFARKDYGKLNQIVEINNVLKSAIIILSNLIKKSTNNFHVNYYEKIPRFYGNNQQLEQVILNLVTNACQALPDKKSKLEISTLYNNETNEIMVIVEDEGIGMTKDTMRYIFDPFFTTKRDRGGTGLGLSISFSIIKNHGGHIKIDSKSGQGTKVIVFIPVKTIINM